MCDAPLTPFDDVPDCLNALAEGRADHAVIPWINSRAGPVVDSFTAARRFSPGIKAERGHLIPIRFRLYRRRDDDSDVTHVLGHPMALAQCARRLAGIGAQTVPCASNGLALRRVSEGVATGQAALGPPDVRDYPNLASDHLAWEDGAAATLFLRFARGTTGTTGCLILFDREEDMLVAHAAGSRGTVAAWAGTVGCVMHPRPLTVPKSGINLGLSDAAEARAAFP